MHLFALLLAANSFHPDIPKTWTDAAVAALEVPLSKPKYSPVHISESAVLQNPDAYNLSNISRVPSGPRACRIYGVAEESESPRLHSMRQSSPLRTTGSKPENWSSMRLCLLGRFSSAQETFAIVVFTNGQGCP